MIFLLLINLSTYLILLCHLVIYQFNKAFQDDKKLLFPYLKSSNIKEIF